MPGIDGLTGRLFTAEQVEAGWDLAQSVEDRILTPLGSRRFRPNYGSLALAGGFGEDRVRPSIERALSGDPRITDVRFRSSGSGTDLEVLVNGSIRTQVTT